MSACGSGLSLGGGGGAPPTPVVQTSQWIEFVVGTATVSSATSIPAGSRILRRLLVVTTAYSAGATIALDDAAALTIMATTDNTPQLANEYVREDRVVWPLAVAVRALVGGAPAAGAATVMVEYVTTPSP
jgi:hypothetical protein